MTPEQLRHIAQFIDALNELRDETGLHLYGGSGIFIDDRSNNSLVRLSFGDDGAYEVDAV